MSQIGTLTPATKGEGSTLTGLQRLANAYARELICFSLIIVCYLLYPNDRPDLTAFNANDSEAYLSLSYALSHGLGYTRSLLPGSYVPHTTWPPGFPVLLTPVTAFSSLPFDWLSIKLYMIAIGVAGILLAWLYVKRLTESLATANIAALLLALLPFYWLFSRTVMTDGVTISFILVALLLMDGAWAQKRPLVLQVFIVGLVSGSGMLLRGTNLCLLLVPLAYSAGPRKALTSIPRYLALVACHTAAFSLPILWWVVRNATIDTRGLGADGVNEFRMLLLANWLDPESTYGIGEFVRDSFHSFVWHDIYRVPEQLLPALWNAEWWNWPGAPFLALGFTVVIALSALPWNKRALPLVFVIVPYAGFLSIWPEGKAVRYWVPVTSLLILLIVVNGNGVLDRFKKHTRGAVLVGMMAVYAANLAWFVARFEAQPYGYTLDEMVTLFDRIRDLQSPRISVHAHHAELFTLRTGLPAPVTVEVLGLEPTYTHIILRDTENLGTVQQPPPGTTLILKQGNWGYYALPRPMLARELVQQDHDLAQVSAPSVVAGIK